jgi:endonuclease I
MLRIFRILFLVYLFFLIFVGVYAQDDSYYTSINPTLSSFISDLKSRIRTPYTKITYGYFDESNIANFASFNYTGGQRFVYCIYSHYQYFYTPPFSYIPFSREHTWCQSWMPYETESSNQYQDQHHLFPVEQNNANDVRSNHPFGVVSTVSKTFYEAKYGTNTLGQTVYEPRNKHKGDAARALLYMSIRYDDIGSYSWNFNTLNQHLTDSLSEDPQSLTTLLNWNSQDPPDKWEVDRNNFVFANQQNRNPFIDHPEYVYYINFSDLTKLSPVYSSEPTNNATNLSATVNGTSVNLSWTLAVAGSQAPSGYLLEAYSYDNYFIPVDGTVYADDIDLSDSVARVNLSSSTNTYTFNNINPALSYYFKIFSYNGNGTSRNYKIDWNSTSKANTSVTNTNNIVLIDDFHRANNNNIGTTITTPTLTWNKIETISPTSIQINNNSLRLGSSTKGRDFAYLDMNSVAGYPMILANADRLITWAFNFRQTRTAPTGFGDGNYGAAFILGKTTNDTTTGEGYAVILGESSTSKRIRLASFYSGPNSNTQFTNLISGSGYSNEYLSVKVTYNPNGNQWSLYVESSPTGFPQSNPLNTSTQIGNTLPSSAFVASTLRYLGCFWNHSTSASDYAYFNDIYISDPSGSLPVNLNSFTFNISSGNVILKWSTSFEYNNKGFEVQRSEDTKDWTTSGFVYGKGNSNSPVAYEFTDKNLMSGIYKYRLKQIDYNGNYAYYTLSGEVIIGTPVKFALLQNYPNPFNPTTNIKYQIPNNKFVTLKIFDMLGKEISTLVNEKQNAGTYEVKFNGSRLSSGIYFYKLESNGSSQVKKMLLVK